MIGYCSVQDSKLRIFSFHWCIGIKKVESPEGITFAILSICSHEDTQNTDVGGFANSTAETKTKILSSIFNSEIVFDGENYRTTEFNNVLKYIYDNINELQGKTKAELSDFSDNSAWVARRGIEPLFKVQETSVLSVELPGLATRGSTPRTP